MQTTLQACSCNQTWVQGAIDNTKRKYIWRYQINGKEIVEFMKISLTYLISLESQK